jgi:hypothetical protein
MGKLHQGLAMDRDAGPQIWNQPFLDFKTEILDDSTNLTKGHSKETVREVEVKTTMTYVDELYNTTDEQLENDKHVAPQVQPLGIGNQHVKKIEYKYVLELDRGNRIIGGYWESEHPDFIWRQTVDPSALATETKGYSEDWTILSDIVRQATQP